MNVDTGTIEQTIVEHDFDLPCECRWHERGQFDSPAKWIVFRNSDRMCCDDVRSFSFWCDPCLQEVLTDDSTSIVCFRCQTAKPGPARRVIARIEPIGRKS